MSIFLNLIKSENKENHLKQSISKLNQGQTAEGVYFVNSQLFPAIPGTPFSYWVDDKLRSVFALNEKLETDSITAKQGLSTADDFRFVRLWWELSDGASGYFPFAKGGAFAEFYSDTYLTVYWGKDGEQIKAWANTLYNNSHWSRIIKNTSFYFKEGLTWARRTQNLSVKILPKNSIFADKGPAIFDENFEIDEKTLLSLCTLMNSNAFRSLVATRLNAADSTARSFEVGIINNTPIPNLVDSEVEYLAGLAKKIINIKQQLESVVENSHQFYLPSILQSNLKIRDYKELKSELIALIEDKERYCWNIYSLSEKDTTDKFEFDPISELRSLPEESDSISYFLSWAVGVTFGRYSSSYMNNSIEKDNDINPFDLLELCSKGMLKDSGARQKVDCFETDELSHQLFKIAKKSQITVGVNLANWLRKSFFDIHLKQYSKGRRQAPIYWPIASNNSSCILWLHYQSIGKQTLLSCINNYVQPRVDETIQELTALKSINARSSKEEAQIDSLTELQYELEHFKERLIELSKFWQPNLNDGVQITAAPLWRLFQHKAWQKKLKQTWEKLEEGEFDWAHLAFSTWPERVLKKCHEDRSLAIAHDVETDLWHEVEVIKGKKKEPVWEWQPKPLSDAELHAYIREKIATDDRLKLYRSNQSANANGGAL
ncbi:MAG: hypothetical protein ACJA2Y_000743 [Cycloclasticus pugetii]|uniref:hypothetical protein n=1 Tax=Cycloclasticus pugetii TaxID=34068 RepID=UPI0039E4368A